ncbi:MAG TPA: FecR family protein [Pedobacter sp.]|nr:FecR family protein [Pedobacter sp.]
MEQNDTIYHLVIKYISKEATEEETIQVLDWINLDEENKILYFRIKDIADAVKSKESPQYDAKLIWDRMLHENGLENVKQNPIPKKSIFLGFLRYAAAAAFIFACFFGYRQYAKLHQLITISTALTEVTKKINLPDHSVIWLKPGSTINYSADFSDRIVNLKGDGFFSVTKLLDETGNRKPFTVSTPKLEVRVLGTSFNVVDNLAQQNVVVKTGTVNVKSEKDLQTLHPGDRVQLFNGELIGDHINANLFMGWVTGGYKFENTGIREIQDLLALNYNCKVVVINPEQFKNISLSGWITAHDEKTLLNTLEVMLSASINKQNHILTIKPQ